MLHFMSGVPPEPTNATPEAKGEPAGKSQHRTHFINLTLHIGKAH